MKSKQLLNSIFFSFFILHDMDAVIPKRLQTKKYIQALFRKIKQFASVENISSIYFLIYRHRFYDRIC